MANLTINEGVKEIEKIISSLKDRRILLKKIGDLLRASSRLRFDTELSPDRKKWIPSLRARREGNKTLTDEGNLRRSLVATSDNDEVNIGTDIEYAKYHQLGIGNNPERAFLGLSAADKEKILSLIQDEIESKLRR